MPVMTSEILVQSATQVSLGTGVAGLLLIRGIKDLAMSSMSDIEVLADMTNGLSGGDTAVVKGVAGKGKVEGWCTYQHMTYWLDNLFGQAVPTGAGPYVRNYAAPINTAPSPRILSLLKGDSVIGAYRLTGSLLKNLTIKLNPKKELTYSGDLIGLSVDPTTLAVGLPKPSVTPVMASQLVSVKMDSFAGVMGTTTLANCTLREYELNIAPDRSTRACVGSIFDASYVELPWSGKLKMVLEFNAVSKADVDAAMAGTLVQKQIELNFASGTQAWKMQFAGTLTDEIQIFGNDNGVVTVNIGLERTYQPTFANWFKSTLTNALAVGV